MKLIKKIWEMAGTTSGSEKLIAVGCMPLTLITLKTCSDVPILPTFALVMNMALLVMAFIFEEDDNEKN